MLYISNESIGKNVEEVIIQDLRFFFLGCPDECCGRALEYTTADYL